MDQNRRRYLRKVPDDIAFIQIERDEVGKVLNISEGGLSFRSVTPVPRNLPVYFWFSFNLKDRIEAMGEVTWTDLSRTIGGLRFTQLSQTNRDLIQKWVSRLRKEKPPEEEIEVGEDEILEREEEALVPQLVAVGESAPFRPNSSTDLIRATEPDRVARFVSKARAPRVIPSFEGRGMEQPKPAPPPELAATALAAPALGIEPHKLGLAIESAQPGTLGTGSPKLATEPPKLLPERPMFSMQTAAAPSIAPTLPPVDAKSSRFSLRGLESLVELVPLQRHLSAKKRQLLCGVLLGIGISALVTLPALKFWNSRAHAETLKPAVADSSTVRNNPTASLPASSAPTTLPAAKPSYPAAGIFSDPIPILPKKGKSQSLLSRTQLPASFWKEERKAAAMREALSSAPVKNQKLPTSTLALQKPSATFSSASTKTDKKPGTNPTQLWTAVQAGNSKAAVELAELYIKGDGVPQNCQQARVLLLVASEKRNTAAIKRLHDLDKGAAACP